MNIVKKYRKLFRITIVSLLVVLVTFGLSRNPEMIEDLKQMIYPAAFIPRNQWDLEVQTIYLSCRHNESVHHYYPSKTALIKSVSKTFQAPHDLRPKNKYTYYMVVNAAGFCDSCREHQFFGIHSGKLVIIKGTPLKPGPILENFQLSVERLPDSERLDLEKGVSFQSEKEKLQLLEGLKSLVAN